MSNHIALFLPSLAGGGAERVLVDLSEGFVARGHQVDLVLVSCEGPYLKSLSKSINVVDLGAGRTLRALPKLVSYLRQNKPQAMLSTIENTNVIAIFAKLLARVSTKVVIREAISTSRSTIDLGPVMSFFATSAMKLFYPRADGIVAVSQGVATDMVQTLGVKEAKVKMILNPVLTERVFSLAKEPLDHAWFTKEAKAKIPVIMTAGRLTKQKDFPMLLDAVAKVHQERPVRLVILGEGEDREALEKQAQTLGIQDFVQMPGFADNPFQYMANASMYVLSSVAEGLPNGLIQAMALAKPVVATDCPSGPREILEEGKYGKLIPMQDADAMARAICESLDEPHLPMSEDWIKRYSADDVVSKYLELLLSD